MNIVIVGGGSVGSSTAYHLASRPDFKGTITVIERDPTYRIASSSLSASSIRMQFSTPVCIAMSQYGWDFLAAMPEAGLKERAYLFLATTAGVDILRENHAIQTASGADITLLDADGIRARFPWMNADDIALGAVGERREGWFDGPGLLAELRRRARALGVNYIAQDATGFNQTAGRITAVHLADGTVLPADAVVNAGGPWAARIAGWAGIDLPVRARKRMIYVVGCREALPNCPLVVDPSGIFFRPEGQVFLSGRSPGDGEPDPDEPPLEVEEDMYHDHVWPALANRVPAFEAIKIQSSWAGYYEYNTFDQNGIIGRHPTCTNLVFANGFSGHGVQHSPATGRGVSELLLDGAFTTLDMSALGFARVINNQPLIERNIV